MKPNGENEPKVGEHVAVASTEPRWSGEGARALTDAFEIEEELGEGAMGRVFAARDRVFGRRVAVKALRPMLRHSAPAVRRFLTEAQVGAQLEHPNIVPVYAFETDDGSPAFAMRLLPGKSFEDLLARARQAVDPEADERLALAARLEVFLAICDAVAYAHSRGVVHRDLKPENVVLGEHRDVYVVDWGIAKVVGVEEPEPAAGDAPEPSAEAPGTIDGAADPMDPSAGAGSDHRHDSGARVRVSSAGGTRAGELMGTLSYMPPEQATGDLEAQGPASDQFALGMILLEVVALRPARDGGLAEMLGAAIEGRRTARIEHMDPELRAIVERATRRRPSQRYPSVDALATDVRRVLRGEAPSVHPDGLLRRLTRSLQKRPAVFTAAFTALIALAALGVSGGLWQTLAERERGIERTASLSSLSSIVLRRTEAIDSHFVDVVVLVEGLGSSAELRLTGSTVEAPSGWGAAGRLIGEGEPLREMHFAERYGMEVSWLTPAFLHPPTVQREEVLEGWSHLAAMRELLPTIMARSGAPEAQRWSIEETRGYLARERPPIHVIYLGLESGLLLNYPGYEPFPEAYDPRRRPWYEAAVDQVGTRFGAPYPDASGTAILVPCNRAMRDGNGRLLGVAGADMALDDVAAMITFDDVAGWRRSELVDTEGDAILDTDQAGTRLGVGLHGDAALPPHPIEPALASELSHGSGWMRLDEELVVYARMSQIDWTLVARFDAAAWLD